MSDLEIRMKVSVPGHSALEAVMYDFVHTDKVGEVHFRDELGEGEGQQTPIVCCEIGHLDAHVPGWRTGACRDPAAFYEFLDRHDADLDDAFFMAPAGQLVEAGYPNQRPPNGLDENAGGER